jgi:hypothetical protein
MQCAIHLIVFDLPQRGHVPWYLNPAVFWEGGHFTNGMEDPSPRLFS